MSDWQKASTDGVEPEMSKDLGDRVSAVIAAAESAAQAIREDAEEDARARGREAEEEAARRLDEAHRDAEALSRRLRESSQEVLESARAVVETVGSAHRQLEGLVEELSARFAGLFVEAGQASARHSETGAAADSATGASEEQAEPRPLTIARMPSREAGPADVESELAGSSTFGSDRFGSAPPSPGAPEEERARRAALQMAAAGRTRGEVAHHLHEVFDLDRVEPVLAHIFGPEEERA